MTTDARPLQVLSLGAGVQSSTLLLMALAGEVERPDFAVFADTQDEPEEVYQHLQWLSARAEEAGLPLHVVSAGRLRDAALRPHKWIQIPTFGSRGGLLRRQCTDRFKVRPINKFVREQAGGKPVAIWIGISLDEAHRMKVSQEKWRTNCYPLVDRRMTRHDCLRWLASRGFPTPPKSACIFCPYQDNSRLRAMRDGRPHEWAQAVAVDRTLNERGEFLHRTLVPLDQVDLRTAEDHGQVNMFGNECEGMCGV